MKKLKLIISKNKYFSTIVIKIILLIISIGTSIIINRKLGPEGKGEYAYLMSLVSIGVIFFNGGIYQRFPYLKNKLNYKNQNILELILINSLCSLIFISILAILLKLDIYFIMILWTEVLAYQLNNYYILKNLNFRNKMNILNSMFYFILLFILFLKKEVNLDYFYLVFIVKNLLLIIVFLIYSKEEMPSKIIKFSKYIKILRITYLSMIVEVMMILNFKIDIFILKRYVNIKEIGIYSVAIGLASLSFVIINAFKDVIYSRLENKNIENEILRNININIVISIIIYIGFYLIGSPFIKILYGENYLPSYRVGLIIFLSNIPLVIFNLLHPYLNSVNKVKEEFVILTIGLLINLILNFYLIPIYGINGAAFASVISYFIMSIFIFKIFIVEKKIGEIK